MSGSRAEPRCSRWVIKRRDFLKSTAVAGIGLTLAPILLGAEKAGPAPINVAVIGTGRQGRVLIEQARRIEGVRFKARKG